MTSPLSETVGSIQNIQIVPQAYIQTASQRKSVKDLTDMPKDELKRYIKSCKTVDQQVIIQDLLIAAGIKLKTKAQVDLVSLAVDLFIVTSRDTQEEFFKYIMRIKDFFNNFVSVITTNQIFHSGVEKTRKGSSGLSEQELGIEESWAKKLDEYRVDN